MFNSRTQLFYALCKFSNFCKKSIAPAAKTVYNETCAVLDNFTILFVFWEFLLKRFAKAAVFAAVFLLINLILCGFMPPDNGSSLSMWQAYHAKDNVDIAVIGSSLASCALPEEDLAAATGESVALLATNAQSWDMSQIALETLLREHTPRYVILVMDLTNMTNDPYPKAQKAFLYAELQTAPWRERPGDLLRYMTSADNFTNADSLNALFPWQSGNWPTDWPATIQQKWNTVLNRVVPARSAAHAQPAAQAEQEVIDFDTVGAVNTWNQNSHVFTQQHIEELTSMLQLCQENGTRLLVISAPKTTLDVISYETYFDDYLYFKQLAAQYGAAYYDFNLAKPELFENREPDYHKDWTHMNAAGGHAFSLCMAKFLRMLDAGQDVDALFKTPQEYLADVDYITNVYMGPELHGDTAVLVANSYQGSSVTPEYEFLVKAPGEETFTVFSPYSDRVWGEYALTEHGTYQFRVNARPVGSDVEYQRYYECSLEY